MERKSKVRVPGKEDPQIVPDEILCSDTLRIDLAEQRVTIAGEPIALQPKVHELLVLLLSEPRRVHTREALFERLWPQSVVLDATLTTAVSQLRKALTPPLRERLRTVPRIGYAWDADVVRQPRALPADADAAADPGRHPETTPDAVVSTTGKGASTPAAWHRRRSRRPAIALAVVGVALVAGLLLWTLAGRSSHRVRPVILLESVETADAADPRTWMAPMVADALQRHLELSPQVRVLGTDDSAGLVAAGAPGGPDGADYRLRVRIVPATDGAARMALQATLRSPGGGSRAWRVPVGDHGLIPASQTLALQILAGLTGERVARQLHAITPAALREYEAGMRAETLSGPGDARAAYERAIALSPGFCGARIRLAKVLMHQGLTDLGAAQWRAASACADLGPEARGEAEAQALTLSGHPLDAAAVFDALAERFPDEPMHRLGAIDARIQHGGPALDRAAGALAALDRTTGDLPTRIRLTLLQARLHRARGEDAEEFAAYRRVADMTAGTGAAMFHADAQFQLGMIHRRRGETDAARDAFLRSAATFRMVGSEANAEVAELNLLLLADAANTAGRRERAAALARFATRAAAAGNGDTAGQALDAAAMDAWSAGDTRGARAHAERAAQLLAAGLPERRLGPEVTLAFIDLSLGDAEAALRRLQPLRVLPGAERQLDPVHLRVEAWRALGRPLRAQAEIDATRRAWGSGPVPEALRSKLACIETGVALARAATAAARSALAQCGATGDEVLPGMWPERAGLASLEGDAEGVARALRGWAEAVGRLPQGLARSAALVELGRFRLEHGDGDGARLVLQSLDADTLAALPPPVAARYWLNLCVLAAAAGDRGASRDALVRADRTIGDRPGALRREYALLSLAESGVRDRAALARLRVDAEADQSHRLAALARGLDAPTSRPGEAGRDAGWWQVWSNVP